MKNKVKTGVVPCTLALIALYLIFGGLLALYLAADYIPYMLAAITVLTPTAVITLLCIFRKPIEIKAKPDKELSDKKFVALLERIGGFFIKILKGAVTLYSKNRIILKLIIIVAVFVLCHVSFATVFGYMARASVAIWQPIAVIVLFIVAVIADKLCKHTETEDEFIKSTLKSVRITVRLIYVLLLAVTVVSALRALMNWDIEKYLKYAVAGIFYYISVFIVISLITAVIRKELNTKPTVVIPIPFIKGDLAELSIIDYLENNTGITVRGLTSIRFIKGIAPITVVLIIGFLWLSTSIIQIDPHSQGAVYRLGSLRENVLQPGIHFVLPYPFDKVELYNTESVKKMTIGYSSTEDTDNLWTGNHGNNEYKLLLGSGDELVSINLRLEYKIKDIKKYLESSASPEAILEAQAYELVTSRTIATNLSTLLSTDRNAFADTFRTELAQKLDSHDIGIEIVSVVLESIHPPLEIAPIYQQIISAEIEAEQLIIEAQNVASVAKSMAEQDRDSAIGEAQASHSTKVAAAKTEVAEFMAGVEAYNAYSNEYKYYKYLKAIREAYKKANLVIVSKDVDSSKIYFGSFNPQQ